MNNVVVSIVDKEDISKTLIEAYLRDVEEIAEIKSSSTLTDAVDNANPDVCNVFIVDVSENDKRILEYVNKVSIDKPFCKFILISYDISTNFIVDVLRSGAKEFIGKPLIKEELLNAVKKIAKQYFESGSLYNRSRIIATYSNKGGLGKTTLAVNLAKELSSITNEKVLLIDLNMHLGDVTAFMNVTPSYDLKYIIDNIEKVENDEEFLLGTIEQYKFSNLYILADSPYREVTFDINSQDITKLLKILRNTFAYIIIDMSSSLDTKFKAVCDESDLILLVTTANIATLRNCKRCLSLFEKFGYLDNKTELIINRFINNEDYRSEDIELLLNKKVFWKIPNSYFTIIEAINKGLTLQELKSTNEIVQNYEKLAQEIINRV